MSTFSIFTDLALVTYFMVAPLIGPNIVALWPWAGDIFPQLATIGWPVGGTMALFEYVFWTMLFSGTFAASLATLSGSLLTDEIFLVVLTMSYAVYQTACAAFHLPVGQRDEETELSGSSESDSFQEEGSLDSTLGSWDIE